jgi:tRNA uracil 4-sulfurtransferase
MIIIRYSEIGTKGKNRKLFEKQLQQNIKHCLKKNNIEFEKVLRFRGRLLVYTKSKCPQLAKVFGIASFSYTDEYDADLEVIKKEAIKFYKEGTFRITCQRIDKVLGTSNEIAQEIGAYIFENANAPVDLHNPDINIHIEFFNYRAYIYTEKLPGLRGLPIGTDSRVVLLLQNKDSVKAGLLMMKRGCALDVLKEKDIDYSELNGYEYGFTIKELEEIPEKAEGVVVSDTVNSLKDYPYFVLRPLI